MRPTLLKHYSLHVHGRPANPSDAILSITCMYVLCITMMMIVEILAATNLQVVQHINSIPPRLCKVYISAGHRTACDVLTGVRDVRVFASQKSRRRKKSETIRINALLALLIRSRCTAWRVAITFSLSTKIIVVPLTKTFV